MSFNFMVAVTVILEPKKRLLPKDCGFHLGSFTDHLLSGEASYLVKTHVEKNGGILPTTNEEGGLLTTMGVNLEVGPSTLDDCNPGC